MTVPTNSAISLAIAIGIGLLIGSERERRKGTGLQRGAAGVRTFALAALAGALSSYLKSEALLVVVAAATIVFSALTYRRTKDPGLTTEFALLVTVLLGALAMQDQLLAAGLSVVTTILLAAREGLHRVLKNLLSEQEVHDALIFLAATLVILPLAPNRALGPFATFNPRKIWELVVLTMAIGGVSYVALRALGSRLGLALAGFGGGFISASATIGTMGNRARRSPEEISVTASAAILATVATVIQMFFVLLVTSVPTCRALAMPLLFSGITAIGYALIFIAIASNVPMGNEPTPGKAFNLRLAFLFAATITAILFLCAFLNEKYGNRGLLLGAALSGFADTHATAISVASLVSSGKLAPGAAPFPILLGFATNTLTKVIVAFTLGGYRFGLRILPGLLAVVFAAFLGMWLGAR